MADNLFALPVFLVEPRLSQLRALTACFQKSQLSINYNKFIFFTGQDRLSGILPKNQTVYTLAVSHPEDKAYNHPEHAYNGITSPYSNIDSCFRTFNSRSWWYIYYPYIVYVYAIRVYYCHEFKSGLCKYR